jgi:methionyl-tRNA formyltransferase
MRVLFAGSPEIAVPSLKALLKSHHTLCGVLTNPDRPRGRGRALKAPPVKEALLESGSDIPLLQYEQLKEHERNLVKELEPDVLAVFAYGRIFGPRFLSLFPLGGVNVHPSLLPKYRGAAPIPAVIRSGESETGITIQKIAPEMDTGDILLQSRHTLDGKETSASLSNWAAEEGARLLLKLLDKLEDGSIEPVPQDHSKASYTRKIEREDGIIDWKCSSREIDRQIRACTPWPRGITAIDNNEVLIHEASPVPGTVVETEASPGEVTGVDNRYGILVQTGDGLLAVRRLQLKSKKPLGFADFHNGYRKLAGKRFGGDS